MKKVALITGITGQDGAFLAEFLLKKGYEGHGIKRRSSLFNTQRIDHLYQDPHVDHLQLVLPYGDLTDTSSLVNTIQMMQPDEIYNLAARATSWSLLRNLSTLPTPTRWARFASWRPFGYWE